jgi:hypothetical protein
MVFATRPSTGSPTDDFIPWPGPPFPSQNTPSRSAARPHPRGGAPAGTQNGTNERPRPPVDVTDLTVQWRPRSFGGRAMTLPTGSSLMKGTA